MYNYINAYLSDCSNDFADLPVEADVPCPEVTFLLVRIQPGDVPCSGRPTEIRPDDTELPIREETVLPPQPENKKLMMIIIINNFCL